MATPITDPALLAKLEASDAPGKPVTDPKLLATLNSDHVPAAKRGEISAVPMFGEEPDLAALARHSGPAPTMPYGEQMRKALGGVDNTVRAVANGIPFSDRFAAGMGALTGVGGDTNGAILATGEQKLYWRKADGGINGDCDFGSGGG